MKNNQKSSREYVVLTPTEEKVVRILERNKKSMSISEISKKAKLARTSIYLSTQSLIHKKIVRKNKFEYSLTSSDLMQSEKYDAERKIEKLLQEMLIFKRGEIIYSIESDEEIEYLLKVEAGLPKWQKTVADKGIVLKGIGSTKALSLFRNMQDVFLGSELKRRSGSARFMVEQLSGPCMLVSFHSSVIFFSRKNKYFYRIDDASIARFVQAVIETLYLNLQYKPLIIE